MHTEKGLKLATRSSIKIDDNITANDYEYLNILRGASILRVMLAHLGLSWFFPPYSYYIGIFFPLLFFISGAVSYTSFKKQPEVKNHLKKRVTETLIPYYLFSALVILLGFSLGENYLSSYQQLIGWITISPNTQKIDIPIQQIWFIKTLIIIHLISALIFKISEKNKNILIYFFALSLLFSAINEFLPIRTIIDQFYITGIIGSYTTWSSITLLSCYLAGSIFYSSEFTARKNIKILLTSSIILSIAGLHLANYDFDYESHKSKVSLFYISTAFIAISSIFTFKNGIEKLLATLPYLNKLFDFCNSNSYSIFLLHTVVLFYIEKAFNWQDLSENQIIAVIRLTLVVIVTLLIAPYFTKITKYSINRVLNR